MFVLPSKTLLGRADSNVDWNRWTPISICADSLYIGYRLLSSQENSLPATFSSARPSITMPSNDHRLTTLKSVTNNTIPIIPRPLEMDTLVIMNEFMRRLGRNGIIGHPSPMKAITTTRLNTCITKIPAAQSHTNINTEAQSVSRLLNLPGELREKIWRNRPHLSYGLHQALMGRTKDWRHGQVPLPRHQ